MKARYRYQQSRLGQKQPPTLPTQTTIAPLGNGYTFNNVGPRRGEIGIGWRWVNPTGDWLDASGIAQGPAPFWTLEANLGGVREYSVDVLAALQHIEQREWWNGFIVHGAGAGRSIAAIDHPSSTAPALDITYSDGASGTLPARVTAQLTAGTSYARGNVASIAPSSTAFLYLEFDRPDPTRKIVAATLRLTVVSHKSGAGSLLGYIVNPHLGTLTQDLSGVASKYGDYDDGLEKDPAIQLVHRYVDGSALTDFCALGVRTYTSESSWNSTLWDDSTSERVGPSYFPELGAGKWVQVNEETTTLVDSSYQGEGFEPLASGMGAIRLVLPKSPIIEDPPEGQVPVSKIHLEPKQSASSMRVTLPLDEIGLQDHIFVRYYFRLGDTGPLSLEDLLQSRATPTNSPRWPSNGGKTGITPAHTSSYGGQSGFGGNGYGWTWRFGWTEVPDEGGNGPEAGGQRWFLHTWDQDRPISYKADTAANVDLGRDSAVGSMFYPGHWYCIEVEHKLNTVMEEAPGYLPDGWYRVKVDGVPVWSQDGMAWRKLPLGADDGTPFRYKSAAIRPFRELGFKELWLNWFHGGTDPSRKERVMFVTGFAYGKEPIGPMKGVPIPDLSRTLAPLTLPDPPKEDDPVPESKCRWVWMCDDPNDATQPTEPPPDDPIEHVELEPSLVTYPLAQFAATVQPGEILEFASGGLNDYDSVHGYPFGPPAAGGVGPMDSAWASCMDLDPVTNRWYFAGGRPEAEAPPQKLISYDASRDQWSSISEWSGTRGGHIYRSSCVIPEHRRVAYAPAYGKSGVIPLWDIYTDSYAGSIPYPPTNIAGGTSGWSVGAAMIWHPNMGEQGSIVWANKSLSRVIAFDWATQQWLPVGRFSATAAWSNNHMCGHYNAHTDEVICGAGTPAAPKQLVIVAADKSTRLSAVTQSNVAANSQGQFVPHPTRSASISLCQNTKRIWSYEWATDEWIDRDALPSFLFSSNLQVGTHPELGVLLICKYGAAGTSKTYVYRPSW